LLQQGASAVDLEVQSQGKASTHVLHVPAIADTDTLQTAAHEGDAWQARGLTGAWSRPVLGELQAGRPAQVAGLLQGDEVLRIDQHVVVDATALRALVRASGQHTMPTTQVWEISRAGQTMQLNVTPEQVTEGSGQMGRIGAQVGEAPQRVWVQYGPLDGITQALSKTWTVIAMTVDVLGRLLTGHASLDNLSGPLTMADYAGRSASLGLGAYLSYLALISVNLGVFNLLPLPMLDGGHLLYYLYEFCTGRAPSAQWLAVMQRAGLAILVTLMAFSLFNDVVRLGWFS
jgi:regulator of sigma E protease